MYPRLALNSQSSCLSSLSTGITAMNQSKSGFVAQGFSGGYSQDMGSAVI
jgi:hypothetical protein